MLPVEGIKVESKLTLRHGNYPLQAQHTIRRFLKVRRGMQESLCQSDTMPEKDSVSHCRFEDVKDPQSKECDGLFVKPEKAKNNIKVVPRA